MMTCHRSFWNFSALFNKTISVGRSVGRSVGQSIDRSINRSKHGYEVIYKKHPNITLSTSLLGARMCLPR